MSSPHMQQGYATLYLFNSLYTVDSQLLERVLQHSMTNEGASHVPHTDRQIRSLEVSYHLWLFYGPPFSFFWQYPEAGTRNLQQ